MREDDRRTFAGVHTRKAWRLLNIVSGRPLESDRIEKGEQVSSGNEAPVDTTTTVQRSGSPAIRKQESQPKDHFMKSTKALWYYDRKG